MFAVLGSLLVYLWRYFTRRSANHSVATEKSDFVLLQKACETDNVQQAYSTLNNWLKWVSPANTLSEFAQACGDTHLSTELKLLQEGLISLESNWQGDHLLSALKRRRALIKQQQNMQSKIYLLSLPVVALPCLALPRSSQTSQT